MKTRIDYILKKRKDVQFMYVCDYECKCYRMTPENAFVFTKEDVARILAKRDDLCAIERTCSYKEVNISVVVDYISSKDDANEFKY